MKITFLCPVVDQGGGNRVTTTYARKLIARGHDVTVIGRQPKENRSLRQALHAFRDRSNALTDRDRFFRDLGDAYLSLPFGYPLDPAAVPEADVIVATWWRTAFEVAHLPPEAGAKAYFVQHHEVHKHLPYDISGGSYWLPLKKITIADWLVETMARDYGDHDVALVPNSVDTTQFNAPPRPRNARPRVGLLYAPAPFKGIDISLKAIEIARTRFPDLEVTGFGTRPPVAEKPLPPGTDYHVRPAQDDIPKIYASCDAWLVGSRFEGFGLPLLEAMACRTPVVSTRAGAAPDLITPGVNGYLADIDDAEAMGARLIDLLSKPAADWQAMSEAAHARAHSYSWDDAAAAFEAALVKIAGAPA